jgi:hypothetical protein
VFFYFTKEEDVYGTWEEATEAAGSYSYLDLSDLPEAQGWVSLKVWDLYYYFGIVFIDARGLGEEYVETYEALLETAGYTLIGEYWVSTNGYYVLPYYDDYLDVFSLEIGDYYINPAGDTWEGAISATEAALDLDLSALPAPAGTYTTHWYDPYYNEGWAYIDIEDEEATQADIAAYGTVLLQAGFVLFGNQYASPSRDYVVEIYWDSYLDIIYLGIKPITVVSPEAWGNYIEEIASDLSIDLSTLPTPEGYLTLDYWSATSQGGDKAFIDIIGVSPEYLQTYQEALEVAGYTLYSDGSYLSPDSQFTVLAYYDSSLGAVTLRFGAVPEVVFGIPYDYLESWGWEEWVLDLLPTIDASTTFYELYDGYYVVVIVEGWEEADALAYGALLEASGFVWADYYDEYEAVEDDMYGIFFAEVGGSIAIVFVNWWN